MKKPEYISISFPERKVLLLRPVQRYLSKEVGKLVKVNFGRMRYRKAFAYEVVSAGVERSWRYDQKKGSGHVEVVLVKKGEAEE